jgi:probable HAF family extracellular repeat protein
MLRRLPVVAIASVVCVVGCGRDVTTAPSDNGLVAGRAGLAAASLSAIDLGVGSPGQSVAFAINDMGEVAGSVQIALDWHAVFWDASGAMIDLGVLKGGNFSEARGINNRSVVVGTANDAAYARAFVWKPGLGGIVPLPILPGGSSTEAADINDWDVIVGTGDDASHTFSAVRWDASGPSSLGTLPGGRVSNALAINNHFEIVGYSDDATWITRPVRWDPSGAIKDLGTLPGDLTGKAWAINEDGNIVGYSLGSKMHAVLWSSAGGIKDLGVLPGGSYSQATGINPAGDISGFADDTTGQQHAVLWERGSLAIVDLGTLPGHSFSAGYAINRNATVAGFSGSNVITHATCWSVGPSC